MLINIIVSVQMDIINVYYNQLSLGCSSVVTSQSDVIMGSLLLTVFIMLVEIIKSISESNMFDLVVFNKYSCSCRGL